jgi:hypothetical protein
MYLKNKKILLSTVICSLIVALIIFYILPNVFASSFIDIRVSQLVNCNKLHGFVFEIHNSYFMPVVLSYPGADAIVDLYAINGSKTHTATFLSEKIHDDEEGFMHLSKVEPGVSILNLSLYESTQYYKTSSIPNLQENDTYRVSANLFGLYAKPAYDPINIYQKKQNGLVPC